MSETEFRPQMPRVVYSAPVSQKTSTNPKRQSLEIYVFHDNVHEATLEKMLGIETEWFVKWFAEPTIHHKTEFGTHRDLGRLQQLVQYALAKKHGWATRSTPEVHHVATLEEVEAELKGGPIAPHRD